MPTKEIEASTLPGDRFVASLFAWLPMHVMHRVVNASEKNGSFPGRLAFFCYISAIFCPNCLEVKRFFVYLPTE